MIKSQCTICRRRGVKLFLKGDRCLSQKCAIIKRPTPPGPRKKRGFGSVSEYGKELAEKQKLKNWYNLREKEFKNYIQKSLRKRLQSQDPSDLLIKGLESRLDNAIFRLGFAQSRKKARQLVSHGYFLINKKKINIPSYQLKKGDEIGVVPQKTKKNIIQGLKISLKKYQPPAWLKLDADQLTAEVVGSPVLAEINPPAEISAIFEFYSR